MEFYKKAQTICYNTRVLFQFPTGWNSTFGVVSLAIVGSGFNSQRDGILQKSANDLLQYPRFVSIPNGMEFYLPANHESYLFQNVSIPNGMEFYGLGFGPGVALGAVSIPNGMEFYYYVDPIIFFAFIVSIPNGMEFYAISIGVGIVNFSFNSQRDGILPGLLKLRKAYCTVSIPNGMEFYFFYSTAGVKMRSVSIPNGMEFYSIANIAISSHISFNSQRDGILLHRKHSNIVPYQFQFPTGWNSTVVYGIKVPVLTVSIPNGMEFYIISPFESG